LFSTLLGVRVKSGEELSTDHHLVVGKLCVGKQTGLTQRCRNKKSYRTKVVGKIPNWGDHFHTQEERRDRMH